jgi:hypothetical protein
MSTAVNSFGAALDALARKGASARDSANRTVMMLYKE